MEVTESADENDDDQVKSSMNVPVFEISSELRDFRYLPSAFHSSISKQSDEAITWFGGKRRVQSV